MITVPRGVFLGILCGGVELGSPNLAPISEQKQFFFHGSPWHRPKIYTGLNHIEAELQLWFEIQ